jgi:hypothetical protein
LNKNQGPLSANNSTLMSNKLNQQFLSEKKFSFLQKRESNSGLKIKLVDMKSNLNN